MELKTERLKLRELLTTDLEKIHELHSLPETDRFNTSGVPETIEITKKLLSEWLITKDELPRKKYVFCLENNEKEFIGLIGINIGKPAYKNAEIWFKLHSKYWNQGFATEAVNRILDFCFNDLNLHRIEAGCAVENIASKRVLEKVGMTKEGLCRKILPIRGEWVDNYEFAILDTDFDIAKHALI
jgi:[ribosomal protein S5]-alanine N-acetyltransferase